MGSSNTLAVSEVAPPLLPEAARALRLMAPEPAAAAAPEPARRRRGRTAAEALPAMNTLLRLGVEVGFFALGGTEEEEGEDEEDEGVRALLAAAAAAVAQASTVVVLAADAAKYDIMSDCWKQRVDKIRSGTARRIAFRRERAGGEAKRGAWAGVMVGKACHRGARRTCRSMLKAGASWCVVRLNVEFLKGFAGKCHVFLALARYV